MKTESDYLQQVRACFPLLQQQVNGQPLVYLDNAATTQKPETVLRAVDQFYRQHNANVHRASHTLSAAATRLFEQARQTVADYLNAASSDEIIWTRGTTESINLVANSWGQQLKAGDEIILSSLEHHANIVPWQLLAQRSGVTIKIMPLLPTGDLDLDQLANLLTERTRLVAVSHVSNALGTINPLRTIIDMAHDAGALVLIDGAQALPHLQVDLQQLGADFYAFSGHKVFAPGGIGVLWGRRELLQQMPPWQGGGEMIERVSFSASSYQPPPFRFEAGTPNIAGAIGLAAALDWLSGQDLVQLAEHENALLKQTLSGSEQVRGLHRIGSPEQTVSLFSFTLDQQHQQDIGVLLDQQGIAVRTGHHCAMPLMQLLGLPGTTRASFAFYNTHQDVDRLLTCLDRLTRPQQVAGAELNTAADLLKQLRSQRDWSNRYRLILQAGRSLSAIDTELKTDTHRIIGCESDTWLICQDTSPDAIRFQADSDAKVIRGLIVLLQAVYNGQSAKAILDTDIDALFEELGLTQHLSPSRGNGLRALVQKITALAAASLQQETGN